MKKYFYLMFVIFFTACSLFDSEWDKAKKENNRTAYVDFIAKNPQSEYLKEAQEKIDSLNWSLFYFLVPNDPTKDRILSNGNYIPKTNGKVEVSTLSLLPQKPCSIIDIEKVFGKPDKELVNSETKYLFVVENIRRILGIAMEIILEDNSTTYGVNVFPSDITGPGETERDNVVYNSFKGKIAQYGRFDLLIEKDSVKQIVINFAHGSLEKSKVDTTIYNGWRTESASDAMFFSIYIPWLTLINDSDFNKIFAKDELRK